MRISRTIISVQLCLLCLVACTHQQTDSTKSYKTTAFNHFIHRLKIIPLPLKLNAMLLDGAKFQQLYKEDTLFIKDPSYFYYGLLADTSSFFAVIMLQEADSYVPTLFTFDKQGNAIDSGELHGVGCPYDPDIEYCSGSGTIGKDFSIHCCDSVCFFELDSASNKIPGTKQLQCNFQDGTVSPNGSILLLEHFSEKKLP